MKFALVSGLAALALAAPATASTGQVTTRIAVPTTGLDLNRPADAKLMARRLDQAAIRVCGASDFSARQHQAAVRQSACYRDAMSQATASLKAAAAD